MPIASNDGMANPIADAIAAIDARIAQLAADAQSNANPAGVQSLGAAARSIAFTDFAEEIRKLMAQRNLLVRQAAGKTLDFTRGTVSGMGRA